MLIIKYLETRQVPFYLFYLISLLDAIEEY